MRYRFRVYFSPVTPAVPAGPVRATSSLRRPQLLYPSCVNPRSTGRPSARRSRTAIRSPHHVNAHTDTAHTTARTTSPKQSTHTPRGGSHLAAESHLSCLSRRGSRPLTASPEPPPRSSPLYRRCYWLSCRHMMSTGRSLRPSSCRHRQQLPAELQVAAGWCAAGPCAEAGSCGREAPMHNWPRHHQQ